MMRGEEGEEKMRLERERRRVESAGLEAFILFLERERGDRI